MELSDPEAIIDVRILPEPGPFQQRSAVFADAGLLDGAVWIIQAAASATIGGAAWAGARSFALSRVRRGTATSREVAFRVAQEFIAVRFGGRVDEPHEEEFSEDGSWRLGFREANKGQIYSVRLQSRLMRQSRPPRVVGATRTSTDEGQGPGAG